MEVKVMSTSIFTSNMLVDLSIEEQQLLSGGRKDDHGGGDHDDDHGGGGHGGHDRDYRWKKVCYWKKVYY
jgi:hypothetical protein